MDKNWLIGSLCLILMSQVVYLDAQSQEKIIDMRQKGRYLQVLDQNGKKISELYITDSMKYLGFSDEFFLIKKGNYFQTYDLRSKKLGELYISSTMEYRNIVGSVFNVKKGSYIQTYNKSCRKIGEYYDR
jgi:hypothetical protein